MSEFDISALSYYLNQYDYLNPYEFEDMVAQMLRCEGWTNVQLTNRTADKGRDIIGVDQKGRKVYVEVKQHRAKIGRPVIQKLHSIMVTENVEKGMVISTSEFSPDAIEYAHTTNIKLINGRKFIESCEYIIKGAPRSDSLCTPINLNNFLKKAYNLLDSNIFSFPKPASAFIEKSKYLPFTYIPYLYVVASVDQVFRNKSGSFYYHMHFPNYAYIFSEDGTLLSNRFLDVKFEHTIDLKNIEHNLIQKNLNFEKKSQPAINRDKLRKFIQRSCTVNRSYRGQNNQVYSRICSPNLANIDIHRIFTYWQLFTAIELKIDKYTKFRTFIKDDKITKIVGVDFPTKNKIPKEIRICQKCQALIFKGALKNKFYVCQGCGMILCKDCVHENKWCVNCAKKIKFGTTIPKKNKKALKSLKEKFKNWKRMKKLFKLEFLN